MGALLSKYSAALVAQPLLTKAITASVMNATEELVSQSVTGKKKKIEEEWRRRRRNQKTEGRRKKKNREE